MTIEKIEKKNPELTPKENDDLFTAIISGKDLTETIRTSAGEFKIRFPRVKDLEIIGRLTAYRLGGIPVESFPKSFYDLMQQIATLDTIVVSGPAWYELAKKENPNFSWGDMPTQELIQEVYALAYNFRREVQEKIRYNQKSTNTRMAINETSSNVTEPGLFDGLSSSS